MSVCEVNALGDGRVNENGGVVALEGRRVIEGEDAGFLDVATRARGRCLRRAARGAKN